MALIDLATARDACNLQDGDTDKDSWLTSAIDAASEVIEYHAGRAAELRTVALNGGRPSVLLPDAVTSVSEVKVNGTATTAYTVDAPAGVLWCGPNGASTFPAGVGNVEVTYMVAEVAPVSKAAACTELVRVWFQGSQQGHRPGFGGEDVADFARSYEMPTDVFKLLAPSVPSRMPGIA